MIVRESGKAGTGWRWIAAAGGVTLLIVLWALGPLSTKRAEAPVCEDAIGCVVVGPEEPLRIGVLQDQSGSGGAIGIEQARLIRMALADRGGTLLGHAVHLEEEDARCSPEGGRVAASKLAADPRIVAVLGTTCSGSAATAIPVISQAGLSMVSGINSAYTLTGALGKRGRDWRPGYYRTRHNGAFQGEMAARFAFHRLGIRRAATIDDGDTYTRGLAEMFRRAFRGLGGNIVLGVTMDKEDIEMAPVLSGIRESGAEFLFIPLFRPQALRLVRQAARRRDFAKIVLLGGSALVSERFVEAIGEAGRGLYFTNVAQEENPAIDVLVERYRRRFGQVELISGFASGHDAVTLLLAGIERAAVRMPDGTVSIGRQALRDTLSGIAELPGLSGKLTCDAFGDCGVPVFTILRLDDPALGVEGLRRNEVDRFRWGKEGGDG